MSDTTTAQEPHEPTEPDPSPTGDGNGSENATEAPASPDAPAATAPPDAVDEPETFDREYVTGLREEAAQHRTRARDLEGQVTQLRERLLTDNVRHLAGDVLADPGDLLTFVDADDLLDEDGHPDPDEILAAARVLVRERPHLASRRPSGPIEQGPQDEPGTVNLAGMLRTRAG